MVEHPLSLKNLTRFDFSREKMAAFNAEWAAREQAYKDKYGDKWQEQMDADFDNRNALFWRQHMNTRIYEIGRIYLFPSERYSEKKRAEFDARLREVYGDQYDEFFINR